VPLAASPCSAGGRARSGRRARPTWAAPEAKAGRVWLAGELAVAGRSSEPGCDQ